ncbi:MAG TPA: alpha/beta fold hydrolase [Acidimicrobiia bacterium]
MTERIRLTTTDGVELETKVDHADRPTRVTVLCHPHPEWGGTMNSPLMIAITRVLVARGHTVIRFNFRGVGESTGTHTKGEAELEDVTAAVRYAETLGLPIAIGGWSFGARMALAWVASQRAEIPYSGVAPPPEDLPDQLPTGPKRIVLGSRDQVIDGEALKEYAVAKGIDLVLTPGDHFFHGRGERIGLLVAEGLER